MPLFHRPLQFQNMLDPSLSRCVRKTHGIVLFQRDSLNLYQMQTFWSLQAKIQSGLSKTILSSYRCHIRQKFTGFRPLPKHLIGGLRIHIDQSSSLFHGNQIIRCLPCRIHSLLQIYGSTGNQQFFAAAGIFHVDPLDAALCLYVCDKPIWPVNKASCNHILIAHLLLLPNPNL